MVVIKEERLEAFCEVLRMCVHKVYFVKTLKYAYDIFYYKKYIKYMHNKFDVATQNLIDPIVHTLLNFLHSPLNL